MLAHARALSAAELIGGRSLFAFCQQELNLSRDQAYRYLACADVVTKHPQVLDALKAGKLNATGVATLAPYVKANGIEDGARVLERAQGKTVEAIELLVVELCPKQDVKLSVRPVPSPTAATQPSLIDAKPVVSSVAIADPCPVASGRLCPRWRPMRFCDTIRPRLRVNLASRG